MRVFVNKVITILRRLKYMNLYFVVTLSDGLSLKLRFLMKDQILFIR